MHISLDSALGRQRRLNSVGESVLQIAPDAAAAYSLRSLTGGDPNVVRVRRESDNTEKDFSGSQIESGEMARWVNEQPTLPLDLRELGTDELGESTGERDGALIQAAAAYSLRKLKEDFTGDVVEVRRNVDGETEGFTAAEVTDGTLENFVSTGEVVYSSDFSVDANNVIQNVGATKLSVTGNNDGISDGSVTKDNVLKVENIGDVPAAPQLRIDTDEYEDSTKGSVTFTYYVPTGHPIVGNYWHIGASLAVDGTEASYSPTGVQIVGGAWTTATVAYENKPSTKRFLTIIDEEVADGTAPAFIPEGDVGDFYYISEIKVYRNEELGLPLDQATGAAAAYSLRNLKASGTDVTTSGDTAGDTTGKYVVQVRRSSDDAVKSFTASEVADGTLENWVNTDVVTYESDFSEGLNSWGKVGVGSTISAPETANGSSGWLKFRCTDTSGWNRAQVNNILTTGVKYRLTGTVYFPEDALETNIRVGSRIYTSDNYFEVAGAADTEQSFSGTFTASEINFKVGFYGECDFYVRDLQVTAIEADGHVRTWYDQSGSDNHAVQTDTAKQPKIVDGGNLIADGIDFDGTDDFLSIDFGSTLSQPNSIFMVHTSDTATNTSNEFFDGTEATPRTLFDQSGAYYRMFAGTDQPTSLTVDANQKTVVGAFYNTTSSFLSKNGTVSSTLSVGSQSINDTSNIGYSALGGRHYDGKMDELIIYNSDQSTKRRAIEENIANHYDISLAAFSRDGTVSTWYDQSGSTPANDATQTDPTKQPDIVLNGDLQKDSLDNPAVKFDNSNDHLANTNFSSQIEGPLTIFTYSDRNGHNGNVFSLTGDADLSGRYFSIYQNADTSQFAARATTSQTISQAGFTGTDARLTTVITTSDVSYSVGTNGNTFVTGTADYGDFPTGNDLRRIVIGKLREGSTTGSQIWGGYIAEIILYSGATHGDQSANRTAIEANIGEHYNITAIPAANDTVNGYVQTWYDQSGEGNDAEQPTADNQPKIVGEVTSGQPHAFLGAIDFDGVNDHLGLTTYLTAQPYNIFSVYSATANSSFIYSGGSYPPAAGRGSDGKYVMLHTTPIFGGSGLSGGTHPSTEILATYLANGASSEIFSNGASIVSGDVGNVYNTIQYVFGRPTNAFGGTAKEFIIYNSDQSANRTAIETNIANQYGITLS